MSATTAPRCTATSAYTIERTFGDGSTSVEERSVRCTLPEGHDGAHTDGYWIEWDGES